MTPLQRVRLEHLKHMQQNKKENRFCKDKSKPCEYKREGPVPMCGYRLGSSECIE